MAEQENSQILKAFYEAINSHDVERAASYFHENGEFKNYGLEKSFHGRAEVSKMFQSWLKAFPDMKLETSTIGGSGTWAFAELTVRGSLKGPFQTPDGEIAARNQKVEVPTCDVVRIQDGKIVSMHCYLESNILFRQLGVKAARLVA